jgi:hypothetical protein
MPLKIIGAGYGRTGTLSLKAALEELGFGRCYHMQSVLTNPRNIVRWTAIMEGNPPDWDSVFEGYGAAVDWPASVYYQDLMIKYPEAKVILTVRDPQRWHQSILTTIYQVGKGVSGGIWLIPLLNHFFNALQKAVWTGIFQDRLDDRDFAIEAFNRHIEAVKQAVPPDRLLIFEAAQGWGPLCAFLGVPVPNTPYPHLNEGKWMRGIFRAAQIGLWGAGIAAIALVILLAGMLMGMVIH